MTDTLPIHLGSVAASRIGRNIVYVEENPAAVQEILNIIEKYGNFLVAKLFMINLM